MVPDLDTLRQRAVVAPYKFGGHESQVLSLAPRHGHGSLVQGAEHQPIMGQALLPALLPDRRALLTGQFFLTNTEIVHCDEKPAAHFALVTEVLGTGKSADETLLDQLFGHIRPRAARFGVAQEFRNLGSDACVMQVGHGGGRHCNSPFDATKPLILPTGGAQ